MAEPQLGATPSGSNDTATKGYVDAVAVGIDWKPSVRVATTATGTLSTSFANGQTVDGVTLATGDRILIKNQSTGSENGIYVVAVSGAPTRATDADSNTEVTANMAVFVEEGTANADTGWAMTNNGAISIGTTALSFTQFTSVAISAGTGLSLSGGTLSIENSGVLTVSHGGTGASTLTGILKGNGTSAMTAVSAPSGTIVGDSDTQTLTNKKITPRTTSTNAPGATPTWNTDSYDAWQFTGINAAITSMTTNFTSTSPVFSQKMMVLLRDNGSAQTITWGTSFQSSGVAALPTTTVAGKTHLVGLMYDGSKWTCIAVDATGY